MSYLLTLDVEDPSILKLGYFLSWVLGFGGVIGSDFDWSIKDSFIWKIYIFSSDGSWDDSTLTFEDQFARVEFLLFNFEIYI